jgi:hypothetical protein
MVLYENSVEETDVNHRHHQSYNSKIYGYLHFKIGPTPIFKMHYLLFLLLHWSWLSSITVTDPYISYRPHFVELKVMIDFFEFCILLNIYCDRMFAS